MENPRMVRDREEIDGMKKAYLYPISAFVDNDAPNEYLEGFMDSLENDIEFLNRDRPSNLGLIDLFRYLSKVNIVFLHWVEDLPDKRGGYIQTLWYFFLITFRKVLRIRLIYILHNKKSHFESNQRMKGIISKFSLRSSDLIITHSKEGLRYLEERGVELESTAIYLPHPLDYRPLPSVTDCTTDFLIWGSIIPYKGIDKFLNYLYQNHEQNKFRIIIAGKVKPAEYKNEIIQYCNENIVLDDRFIPDRELEQMMANSKAILFTYLEESVLSSGALMLSLSYRLNIVAPHTGAFKDASEDGLIHTYNSFEDLLEKADQYFRSKEETIQRIERFIEENDWEQFGQRLSGRINAQFFS